MRSEKNKIFRAAWDVFCKNQSSRNFTAAANAMADWLRISKKQSASALSQAKHHKQDGMGLTQKLEEKA